VYKYQKQKKLNRNRTEISTDCQTAKCLCCCW